MEEQEEQQVGEIKRLFLSRLKDSGPCRRTKEKRNDDEVPSGTRHEECEDELLGAGMMDGGPPPPIENH